MYILLAKQNVCKENLCYAATIIQLDYSCYVSIENRTWKATGWIERDRSLLWWRSRYSRFRTDARTSPGMLWMEFLSRCSSTRLRGKPFGTTVRLLFDRSRHSRLPSRLQKTEDRARVCWPLWLLMSNRQEGHDHKVHGCEVFHLNVSLSMPSLPSRLFCR